LQLEILQLTIWWSLEVAVAELVDLIVIMVAVEVLVVL